MAEIHIEKKKPVWPWVLATLLVLLVIGGIWFFTADHKYNNRNTVAYSTTAGTAPEKKQQPQKPQPTQGANQPQVQTQDQKQPPMVGVDGISADSGAQNAGPQQQTAVNDFVGMVEDTSVQKALGRDHELTSDAMMRLSAALLELSGHNQAVLGKIDSVQKSAEAVQNDPESMKNAGEVRQAFVTAADALQSIQQQHYPDSKDQVTEAAQAAKAVNPDEKLQQDEVNKFFEETAQAVEEMSNANI